MAVCLVSVLRVAATVSVARGSSLGLHFRRVVRYQIARRLLQTSRFEALKSSFGPRCIAAKWSEIEYQQRGNASRGDPRWTGSMREEDRASGVEVESEVPMAERACLPRLLHGLPVQDFTL